MQKHFSYIKITIKTCLHIKMSVDQQALKIYVKKYPTKYVTVL